MTLKVLYPNKLKYKKINKIVSILIFLLLLISIIFYEFYRYKSFLNDFKLYFEDFNFSNANNLLINNENLNPFKITMLNNDLYKYFDNQLDIISDNINNEKVSFDNSLLQLNAIYNYNIVNNDKLNNIYLSINFIEESINNYLLAIKLYNEENYEKAIYYFKKVSPLDVNYPESLKYLSKSKDKIKENLFLSCDDLTNNDHYSEAISLLSNKKEILNQDYDINQKILSIKEKQQDYLNTQSAIAEASSYALIKDISYKNINTLNIESSTPYFVNVDLKNQKTYIYTGSFNKWNLLKVFSCSTGLDVNSTPRGSFTIKERGEWFFSEEENEGGKYWTQITGNILFHSVPFAKDKTTILDYTMNKPASHGCVRLYLDDAKWIYTNIPQNTKVIIK